LIVLWSSTSEGWSGIATKPCPGRKGDLQRKQIHYLFKLASAQGLPSNQQGFTDGLIHVMVETVSCGQNDHLKQRDLVS
jgi:hypothetical protein